LAVIFSPTARASTWKSSSGIRPTPRRRRCTRPGR